MKVIDIKPLDNGGAEVIFDLTEEEVSVLFSSAIYSALREAIEAETARMEALA